MNTTLSNWTLNGNWYKGNLHLHTTRSDGALELSEVAQRYSKAGYDFIAITDHWKTYCRNGDRHPLLVLDGVELDGYDTQGSYYHVVAIGPEHPIPEEADLMAAMTDARKKGALLIWAHPHWTGNSVEEGLRHGFDGLEIYNHGSQCEISKGYAEIYWDQILEKFPRYWGFATDDAHFTPEAGFWDGGWVMVNAPECSREAILTAIRKGRFYATQGPEFRSIHFNDNQIFMETSPVRFARLIGPRYRGKWIHRDEPLHQAGFEIPEDWDFIRLEIEDEQNKRAWSNPISLKG
jgi:hypothetical protein